MLLDEQVGGATLNVFVREPLGADHRLLRLPQFIATPHLGGLVDREATAQKKPSLAARPV